ncbi:hypothetical protein ZA09F29_44140 [Escherichia coli]
MDYYNDVESKMAVLGPLRDFREYAAKNAEYMARLAGLIHHFSGEEGDISPYTAEMARELAIWYGNEYIRLSSPLTFENSAQTVTMRLIPEELELFSWIKSYCIEKGIPCMKKMTFYSVVRTVSVKKINSTGYWIYCMNKTELYRLLREKRGMSHLTLTSERLNR